MNHRAVKANGGRVGGRVGHKRVPAHVSDKGACSVSAPSLQMLPGQPGERAPLKTPLQRYSRRSAGCPILPLSPIHSSRPCGRLLPLPPPLLLLRSRRLHLPHSVRRIAISPPIGTPQYDLPPLQYHLPRLITAAQSPSPAAGPLRATLTPLDHSFAPTPARCRGLIHSANARLVGSPSSCIASLVLSPQRRPSLLASSSSRRLPHTPLSNPVPSNTTIAS